MARPFLKLQGLGNDFILLEAFDRERPSLSPEAAKALCDRRFGIGADGVLTLLRPQSPGAVCTMHIFNADGSEAEMCGNGLRCAVLHLSETSPRDRYPVDTAAGLQEGRRLADDAKGRPIIEVRLSDAELIHPEVQVVLGERRLTGLGISMGNPHLVLPLFPGDTDLKAKAERWGPGLEHHPAFPQRTNVGFMKRAGEGAGFDLVVFERGAGITMACGTGASAAAVAAWHRGESAGETLSLHLPGGALQVRLEGQRRPAAAAGEILAKVWLIGPAERVFSGQI